MQGKSSYLSGDTEIDLVAVNEDARVIRFGSCRRSPEKLVEGAGALDTHVERFLNAHRQYRDWTIEKIGIAPRVDAGVANRLDAHGHMAQDLDELLRALR